MHTCIRINVLSRVLSDGLRNNELFRTTCCTEIKTRANKEEGGGGKEVTLFVPDKLNKVVIDKNMHTG